MTTPVPQPDQNQQTLAQRVKAKYPEYQGVDDAELETKVLAKYPEYANVPRTTAKQTAQPATPAEKPGILDTISNKLETVSNQPLTSHVAATEAGLANVGQGVVQGIQGVASLLKGPQDEHEKAIHSTGGVGGLTAYRLGKSLIDSAKGAAQVPAAIHDINQSPDPTGTYLSVAGKTAGQAGGQAALAVATEGAAKAAPKVAGAVGEGLDTVRGKGVQTAEAGVKAAQGDVAATTAKASQAAAEAHPTVLSQKVMETVQKTAQREGFQVTASTPREAVPELGSKYQARAKAAYQSVDKAVGGELQPVLDGIDETKMGIKANAALDPEKAASLREKLTGLETKKAALIQKAAANGVADADKVIKSADTDYARFKGLEAVGKQIKSASGEVRTGGLPDVKKYASAIDRLNDTGKLQKALPQEAAELKQHGIEALDRSAKAKEATGLSKAAADKLSKAEQGVEKAKANRYRLVKRLTGVGIVGGGAAALSKILE
jgi:hypothetical protein